MATTLFALIFTAISQIPAGLCGQSEADPNTTPIIQDLYVSPRDSSVFIKANCPCFCTLEENNLFVFQTKQSGELIQAWRIEGVADISMSKPNEIIAINKLPPDDNGNQSYNTLKTVYAVSGKKITSKDGDVPTLSKTEMEQWKSSISDFSIKQKPERTHQLALALFKQKNLNSAIALLLPIKGELEVNHKVEILNDLGFFLEQANRAMEAIPVLEKVVAFDATRTPAYLNLADAYAKAGDKSKAKSNYQKYVELMEKSGKGAKVPARVRDYLKS